MSRIVKRRRGSTLDHSEFVGAVGESTIDTDKHTVVVHDGVTPGGFPLAREDMSGTLAVVSTFVRQIVMIFEDDYAALSPRDAQTLYLVIPATLFADKGGFTFIGYESFFHIE